MTRIFIALIAVTFIGVAAPASAFSLQLGFPTLTYPTQPTVDVDQACTNLVTLSGDTCATTK